METTRVIKDAISKKYPAVNYQDTLRTVIATMTGEDTGALVVKQHGEVIGIVTVADVVGCIAEGNDIDQTPIASFMTHCEFIGGRETANPCAQLDEDLDVVSALKVMHSAGVNHLLVSGGGGEPIGMVSSLQLIKLLDS